MNAADELPAVYGRVQVLQEALSRSPVYAYKAFII